MDKPKFNLIDGLIVVLLVLVIAAGVYFIKGMGEGKTETVGTDTNAIFEVQVTRAEKLIADKFEAAMKNDETVWVGVKERFEGKILEVRTEPSARMTTDLYSGKAVLAKDPTSYDVTIKVSAAAVETYSSISASGTAIRVGDETLIRGKDVAGYGFVISLETAGE